MTATVLAIHSDRLLLILNPGDFSLKSTTSSSTIGQMIMSLTTSIDKCSRTIFHSSGSQLKVGQANISRIGSSLRNRLAILQGSMGLKETYKMHERIRIYAYLPSSAGNDERLVDHQEDH